MLTQWLALYNCKRFEKTKSISTVQYSKLIAGSHVIWSLPNVGQTPKQERYLSFPAPRAFVQNFQHPLNQRGRDAKKDCHSQAQLGIQRHYTFQITRYRRALYIVRQK